MSQGSPPSFSLPVGLASLFYFGEPLSNFRYSDGIVCAYSILRCQMVITFFECILWLVLLIFVLIGLGSIDAYPFNLEGYERGGCAKCIGGYAFTAYITAGLFEELVKYLAIRRIVYSPLIINPRALWVYGVCAGAGFATLENVMYVAQFGITSAILRAILAVPLHCCTGLMLGLSLSQMRFGDAPTLPTSSGLVASRPPSKYRSFLYSPPMVLLPCIFVHGTYDFVLFVGSGVGGNYQLLALLAVLILIVTVIVIRWRIVVLGNRFPEKEEDNVHILIRDGYIPRPCGCCLCCVCCYT